jgi:transposase
MKSRLHSFATAEVIMANFAQSILCGVDVSKETLDIATSDEITTRIPNTREGISQWLVSLPQGSKIALESTGRYHEAFLDLALAAGFDVYMVNGHQLHHYRQAVGPRAKTDVHDAQLLRRYLCHEHDQLTSVIPLNEQQKRLWQLLKRRAMLIKMRTQLTLAMKGDCEFQCISQGPVNEMNLAIKKVEELMFALAKSQNWERAIAHCRSVPGIGPLNALALVTCFHRGTFQRVDQFIAYLGLDVRVRDSGRLRGKRKLTKRGEPELRRLLYMAAWSFAKHPKFRSLYEQMRNRGLSATAANVAMARKLARIAFALMKKDEDFMLTA